MRSGESEDAPETARERVKNGREWRVVSEAGLREAEGEGRGVKAGKKGWGEREGCHRGRESFSLPRTAHCGSGLRETGLQGEAKLVQVKWVTVRDYHIFWNWMFSNCIILLVLNYPLQESRVPPAIQILPS